MAFEFIDNSTINPNSRRRIRSHVMKGKNLGKTKPQKAKIVIAKRSVFRSATLELADSQETIKLPDKTVIFPPIVVPSFQAQTYRNQPSSVFVARVIRSGDIPRPSCNEISLWPMPIELDPVAQKTIHSFLGLVSTALYPPEFCLPEDIASSIWIQYMFMDEAYLECTLALSAIYVNAFMARQSWSSDNEKAVPHLARAFKLVNQKISGRDATSDLTIATVLSLSIYERLQGNYEIGTIHLRGLKRMVELRGGISKISKSQAILQKIFRADIELAFHFGTPPLFPFEDIPGQDILTDLQRNYFHDRPHESGLFRFLQTMSPDMQDVFFDVMSISHYLDTSITNATRLQPLLFQAILIKVCYKLIKLCHMEVEKPATNAEDFLRLSMIALMTTFWFQYGTKSHMFPILHKEFRRSIEVEMETICRNQELLLWAILIGGGSMFTDKHDSWLVVSLARISQAMNLRIWEDVRHAINGFPWVKSLHEKAGKHLFTTSKYESGIQIRECDQVS